MGSSNIILESEGNMEHAILVPRHDAGRTKEEEWP